MLQKRDICPFYKNGYCISPMLDSPSDIVVSANRCFKTYKTCRYYVDQGEEKQGLENFQQYEKIDQDIKFYPKISLIQEKIDSGCEFFQLMKTENGFIASCKILNRIITESQAQLCSKYWQTCPLRRI